MRARHGDRERRARARRLASRGSASVEYGLIVGLIGAVLCLGIGVTMRDVFQHTVGCLIAQVQGGSAPADCDSGTDGGGGGGGGDGGDAGGAGGIGGTGSTTTPPTSTTTPPSTEPPPDPTDSATDTPSPSLTSTTTPPQSTSTG